MESGVRAVEAGEGDVERDDETVDEVVDTRGVGETSDWYSDGGDVGVGVDDDVVVNPFAAGKTYVLSGVIKVNLPVRILFSIILKKKIATQFNKPAHPQPNLLGQNRSRHKNNKKKTHATIPLSAPILTTPIPNPYSPILIIVSCTPCTAYPAVATSVDVGWRTDMTMVDGTERMERIEGRCSGERSSLEDVVVVGIVAVEPFGCVD
jgi:hypothetical protein